MAESGVKVGYVRRAHGVRGAVIVRVLGDEAEQFVPDRLLATDHGEYPTLEVRSATPHKDGLLINFDQVADRDGAEELRGTSLFIDAGDRRALDIDEFWIEQLLGMAVVDRDGEAIGSVKSMVPGPQDRLVVATERGDREIPFVAAIVTSVDLDSGVLMVDPPEGLLY